MNFVIQQLILWLEDGGKRVLNFKANKINVITGGSATGKSSVLEIIDYCLCSSKPDISHEDINENVKWYGIVITLESNTYTIARAKLVDGYTASDEYYFSASAEIPGLPTPNISEKELKSIIEKHFSINGELVIPYGGKRIKAGSKLSFRYFLLFNTQSDDVIISKTRYFDKLHILKYKEALDRIFDIALGISTPEIALIKEQLVKIEKELLSLDKKEELVKKHNSVFFKNIFSLIIEAKEYNLINVNLPTADEGLDALRKMVSSYAGAYSEDSLSEYDNLHKEKRDIIRKIRNIQAFEKEYREYQETVKLTTDSLKPVDYIKQSFSNIVLAPSIIELINSLSSELTILKDEVKGKAPIAVNADNVLIELKSRLSELNEKIKIYPTKNSNFESDAKRLIFIGEVKAKLEFYTQKEGDSTFDERRDELRSELESLQVKLDRNTDTRNAVLSLLHDFILSYVEKSTSLGRYQKYKPLLNIKEKILQLRAPEAVLPSNVGSSSNYLFLHLCLFLGLHDFFASRKIPYIAQYLFLDQLSRPYYEEVRKRLNTETADEKDFTNDDRDKLLEGFRLLDNFVAHINKKYKKKFQIILIEHVSPELLDEANLKNYHLVENFRNGNALIPN